MGRCVRSTQSFAQRSTLHAPRLFALRFITLNQEKTMPEKIKNAINQLNFNLAEFTFHLTAKEAMWLPEYKGSALRGGFGNVFKKVCCVVPGQKYCNHCQLNTACAYAYIFETPQTQNCNAPIQSTNLPHPFVILPPLATKEVIESGEKLSFKLTLIGKGIDFLPYFIYAFDELGRTGLGRNRGQYVLEKVTENRKDNEIYTHTTQTLTGDFQTISFPDLCKSNGQLKADELTLQFLTPTRILFHNQLAIDLKFDILIRNLLRRASLLAQVHCGNNWDLDYKQILEFATNRVRLIRNGLSWQDWERYSRRQEQRHKLGGFVGKVAYKGDIEMFLPLIRLGEFIHLGKGTSFGMGRFFVG